MFHSVFEDYNIYFTRNLKCLDYIYYPTNSLFAMVICVFFISYIFSVLILSSNIFENISVLLLSPIYNIVYNLVMSNLGKKYIHYVYFYMYLFLFILFNNLIGLIPFTFAETSHLTSTVFIASIIWVTSMLKGFLNHGINFFSLFCPTGVPYAIIPLLVFIETMSYCFRLVSLGLRLFANVFAGHVLLDTIGVFAYKIAFSSSNFLHISTLLFSLLPLVFFIILVFFECIVAVLQSYVFVILSIIYLSEAYALH